MTSYFSNQNTVFMRDGGRTARLTQAQCDQLLSLFSEAGAAESFNALWDASRAAGYVPWGNRFPAGAPFSHTRRMLEASVAALPETGA